MRWCDIVFTRYLVYLCTDIDSYGHTELYNYEARGLIFSIYYELKVKSAIYARVPGVPGALARRCPALPGAARRCPALPCGPESGGALVALTGPRWARAGLARRVWGSGWVGP